MCEIDFDGLAGLGFFIAMGWIITAIIKSITAQRLSSNRCGAKLPDDEHE